MKTIKLILPMIVVVLAVVSLISEYNLTAYIMMVFSIINAIEAVDYYKQNKKMNAMIMLFFSVVIFVIAILLFLKIRG